MNRKILLILMGAMMLLTKASAQTTEQEDAVGHFTQNRRDRFLIPPAINVDISRKYYENKN